MADTPENRATNLAKAIAWWGALFGGFLLFLHFLKIGYLPRFDLTSLMGTIAGVAGLGLFIVLASLMALVCPGMALLLAEDAGAISRLPARVQGRPNTPEETANRKSLVLAWLVGAGSAAIVLPLILLCDRFAGVFKILLWTTPLVWMGIWVAAEIWRWAPLARSSKRAGVFFFITFLFFGTFSFFCLYLIGSQGADALTAQGVILIVFALLIAQGVIYASKGAPFKLRVASVAGIALFLACGTSLSSAYTEHIGRFFRFGMMRQVQLVVTERGCAIVQAAGNGITCTPSRAGDAYVTAPLDLWTRIGADSLLSAPGDLGHATCPRFLLPNAEILSLRIDPANATTAAPPRTASRNDEGCPSADPAQGTAPAAPAPSP
ncbi:hypothetical protein [Xanthomonas arboricola]|uniref:hypothetical protein n=1 Tax=Xanthomonas arboricola TaxID=56448 RepID=UPI000CEE4037|nr:hypothetical protein [Xanthomonas arboricola]PPT49342.1 hypothetical protein XarjCFBP7652_09030 [Xanthomonas arboricola]